VDTSPKLTPAQVKYIQQVTRKILFYAWVIDNTMIHVINDIAASGDVKSTYAAATYLLNYATSNPNDEVIYRASNMILNVDSNAAYLVHPKACSCIDGYLYLRI